MKNIFVETDANEIINRIEKLSPSTPRLWGKMNVSQMLSHCGNALDMAMGTINPRRIFIGRIIGGLIKSKYVNEVPFSRSSPTSEEIKVTDARDFVLEKARLIRLIKQFSANGEAGCTKHPHPFFGALTPSEWSRGMYKHLDHHIRQFGT